MYSHNLCHLVEIIYLTELSFLQINRCTAEIPWRIKQDVKFVSKNRRSLANLSENQGRHHIRHVKQSVQNCKIPSCVAMTKLTHSGKDPPSTLLIFKFVLVTHYFALLLRSHSLHFQPGFRVPIPGIRFSYIAFIAVRSHYSLNRFNSQ
jgi:hypothetical protein